MKSSSSLDISQDTVRSSVKKKEYVFEACLGFIHKRHYGKKKKKQTYFQSGERVVNDAHQHPPGFYRVDCSVQKETPLLLLSWFDQHIAPVEVPARNGKRG